MKIKPLTFKSLLAAVMLAVSSVSMVTFAPAVSAQQNQTLDAATASALNEALATGNAQAVELVVAANQSNPAALQAIATIVLAAAQSIKAADPAGAGILAAIALTSGGLQGNAAITATNLVNASSSAIAAIVVSFHNAGVPPAVVANAVLVGVTTNPVNTAGLGVAGGGGGGGGGSGGGTGSGGTGGTGGAGGAGGGGANPNS